MNAIKITPVFNDLLNPKTVIKHVQELTESDEPIPHSEILNRLLEQFEPLDFESVVFPEVEKMRERLESLEQGSEQAKAIERQMGQLKLYQRHYLVVTIEKVIQVAEQQRWGLCKNQSFIYLYNGAYWMLIDKEAFQKFLGDAALRMGVPKYSAKLYQFMEALLKQFIATGYLQTPEPPKEAVYINLKNGTFQITPEGMKLRPFDRSDFITYQLPFPYDPNATAPIFEQYLNRVLPDKERQNVLAEFLGYVFIRNGSSNLKEEKALMLYGTGANGKSVFFEVVNALLGIENVSSYSLQSLTDTTGYFRAMIANKLVNYASEINGKLEVSTFKQLVSGEPVDARLPYGNPMVIRHYAKLIFNCNELPKEVEHSNAYYRRFLIIPFDVTIPEHEQDKQLHTRIIESELSGVFNWVLDGLKRLLAQKRFSDCDAAKRAVENYKSQSDSVNLYLEENQFQPSSSSHRLIKDLYQSYRAFCNEDGFKPVSKSNFIKRLQGLGIVVEKRNIGNVAFLQVSSAGNPKKGSSAESDKEDLPF